MTYQEYQENLMAQSKKCKPYNMDQVAKALLKRGFRGNGGCNGITYHGDEEEFNEHEVRNHYILEKGYSSVMACVHYCYYDNVRYAMINGVFPEIWWKENKSEL